MTVAGARAGVRALRAVRGLHTGGARTAVTDRATGTRLPAPGARRPAPGSPLSLSLSPDPATPAKAAIRTPPEALRYRWHSPTSPLALTSSCPHALTSSSKVDA